MIHVFCDKRGSGKTKALISLANERVKEAKGNVIYIDDDNRPYLDLDRKIRFITTEEYELLNSQGFYGFLCGILSRDYDIDNVFIDGLFNIVKGEIKNAAHLFSDIEKLSKKYKIEFFININEESSGVPDFIRKYVA